MTTVLVRGADGSERELALVRLEKGIAYVCPLGRFAEVEAGDEDSVVGFRTDDIREMGHG